MLRRLSIVLFPIFFAACSSGEREPAVVSSSAPLSASDVLVQPGAHLVLLGVTDDDHAIYQDGQTVYATALRPGAPRARIDDVPAGNTAFIYVAGKVAFVWTNPDYSKPGFGVSPLVVWTAAHGAKKASDASPIGTLVTAASDDGRRVVFPDNTDPAGSVADLVLAPADLSERTTLVAQASANFPSGACRPEAVFLGHGPRAYPAAAYCTGGGAAQATLSTWRDGVREDVGGINAPPRMFVDPLRDRIATVQVDPSGARRPVVIGCDDVTTIDDVPSTVALFAADGQALFTDTSGGTGPALRRARLGRASAEVAPSLQRFYGFGSGSEALGDAPTSANGRWLLFGANVDPQTGLTDLVLADLHAGTRVTLDASLANTTAPGNPFTSDSRFVITNTVVDPITFAGPFVATRLRDLVPRTISDDLPMNVLPAAGSTVVVGDHTSFDPVDFFASKVDLSVVDLADDDAPRIVARGANVNFFLAHHKTEIVYAVDGTGIRVNRVR
jgi:hypothetical protein